MHIYIMQSINRLHTIYLITIIYFKLNKIIHIRQLIKQNLKHRCFPHRNNPTMNYVDPMSIIEATILSTYLYTYYCEL